MMFQAENHPWDTSVLQNDNSLTAVQDGASYQWVECVNYTEIEGATSQDFTPTSNGDFAVIINVADCVYMSDCYSVTGVGLDDARSESLPAYPVPSMDRVQIPMPAAVLMITVENVLGQQVFATQFSGDIFQLSLNDLGMKGWYTVRAYDKSGIVLGRARVIFQ